MMGGKKAVLTEQSQGTNMETNLGSPLRMPRKRKRG